MGAVKGIDIRNFPKQGNDAGRRVRVCFHYNAEETIGGEVVRDDLEEPFRGIIKLDDGRYVLMTECQYQVI